MQKFLFIITLGALFGACSQQKATNANSNILFEQGAYPYITQHNGTFYYTMQSTAVDTIALYSATSIEGLPTGQRRVVLTTTECGKQNFYSPELHRINNKWYLYFEADDGNTDNHSLYVMENSSDNPMQGNWEMHGPIVTNDEWNFGIHPTSIVVNGTQYLLWSGWQKRRTETETQCIFIAAMENPWTLRSERSLISMPQYEWERQWINPDGTRSAYPIFVNENPEAFITANGHNVVVTYSASGIWTVFNTLGVLTASVNADLLNPQSWTKAAEPQFVDESGAVFGASNISVVATTAGSATDADTNYIMLYQAKHRDESGNIINDIRYTTLQWDADGLPLFGKP
jgi:GH43 family beta-xylosidase